MLLLIYVLLCFYYRFIDGRVVCEDENATPWTVQGYSCPVNCDNVITIIDRLKLIDYKIIVDKRHPHHKLKGTRLQDKKPFVNKNLTDLSLNDILNERNEIMNEMWEENERIETKDNSIKDPLREKKMLKRLRTEVFLHSKRLSKDKKCSDILKGDLSNQTYWSVMQSCAKRNGGQSRLIKVVTNIFNQYGDGIFDENMTSMLLKSVLGNEIDLRHGIYDISTVLTHISRIVELLRTLNDYRELSVRVAPRHCLNVRVPGCYCKRGFVEKSAMCVHPTACIEALSKLDQNYLKRIQFL